MKERIHWIDICKAIAITAIVIGHVLRGGAVQQYVLSFHVPLFFMLSGVVFSDGGKGFLPFFKNKLRVIMVPYFIWGFLSCIIYALLGSFAAAKLNVNITQDDSFLMTLLSFVYGNESVITMVANLPLWFLPCLFAEYIIMYPTAKANRKHLPLITILCFAVGGINSCFLHIYRLPFNLENAVFMSGFFALGMCIHTTPLFRDAEKFSPVHTVTAVALLALGAVLSQMNGHIAYSWSVYGNYYIFVPAALCGCIGWVMLSRQLALLHDSRLSKLCKGVEAVGMSTLAILVMHKFPILVFQTAVPVVKTYLADNNAFCGIITAAVVIALCMAAKWVLKKILKKYSEYVF